MVKQLIIGQNNDLVLNPLKIINFGEMCSGKQSFPTDLKWEETEDEIFFS